MKVLLLATDVYFKGGIERYTRYQYRALKERYGNENIYLYSLKSKKLGLSFEDDINITFSESRTGLVGKFDYTLNVFKAVSKIKPDLIIINHINLSPIGFVIKKIFKIPYFLNVYGLEIWSGIGKIKKISLFNANKIIGDCNFILNYLHQTFKVEKSKLHLLYDPVDTDRFKPAIKKYELFEKYGIPKDKFILLTVGRLDRFKGHTLIIDALKNLPKDIIYLIVGGGKLEKQLKEQVKFNNLEERVIFTGRVPEDELVDFYNLCDVFVLISKFAKNEGEGLPLTPIEAASCGKAIIVGNEDGSSEACENGVSGFIVERDEQVLIEKILTLYNNSDMRINMGLNARKKVLSDFSYNRFKKIFYEIIEK